MIFPYATTTTENEKCKKKKRRKETNVFPHFPLNAIHMRLFMFRAAAIFSNRGDEEEDENNE